MSTTLVPPRERELPSLPGAAAAPPARRARRLPGALRGPASRPAWARPALLLLLAATAVLYLWDLGASGWGNQYYAAAAQAGSLSWKALFFGALDPGNAITVDKPPASIWVMGLSARVFGLSSWSLLVPQALMGVASVALLHAAVRRVAGPAAALTAGAVLALTPVATLMFRFDNPDALLVLLLVGAAYALTRALERASTGWLLAAGSLVGWAFLAKMLQAFLVVPAFALVYLVAAPTPLRRRLWQLVAGGVALVASAGWWVATVELWPAASRPYVGGSTDDSVLDLVLGYNGLSRLTGEGEGPGGGGPGGGFSGTPGAGRLFNDLLGGEVSWLLPAAGLALAAGLWLTRRRPRTDRTRAALVLWGGWLVVTGAVFSLMDGIVHPYYAVALAPAIGALVGIGGRELWRARRWLAARATLAAGIAGTAGWSWALLDRTPDWQPWLRYAIAAAAALAIALVLDPRAGRRGRALLAVTVVAGAIALLGGAAAYSAATATQPHTGSTPASGPQRALLGGVGGPGGAGGPFGQDGGGTLPPGRDLPAPSSAAGGASPDGGMPAGGPGGGAASEELVALVASDAGAHRWAAATQGAMSQASLQLESGQSVMAIGGFTGSDPSPTLEELQALVAAGEIHWYVAGGGGGPGGRGGGGSEIASWVAEHYESQTVGGTTVYDLTAPLADATA